MSVKLLKFHQQISLKPDALMFLFLQCQSILSDKPENRVCNCKDIGRFNLTYFIPLFAGNKAKWRISKQEVTRKW